MCYTARSREGDLIPVEILELASSETNDAASVLGRGMHDNPLHVRVFRGDSSHREVTLTGMFKALLRQYASKRVTYRRLRHGVTRAVSTNHQRRGFGCFRHCWRAAVSVQPPDC